ncbi:YdcF family protein [Salipiger abyssi]|uniref:YdcF family protein n=1 Tax=Salipiger abyssi TaxID=1250539 RepID=UPI002E2844B2|nr:YdcF family protein [Salipiger abyssi]
MRGRSVALVLGAAVREGGFASPALARRAERAVQLWRAGEVGAIIGCGGVGRFPPAEAAAIVALCRAARVPDAVLLEEGRSLNTEQNIRFALPHLTALGAREVVLVSDLCHLPRALLVARRAGLRARGVAPPLKGSRLLPQLKAGLREIPAFLWYALRGAGR